MRTGIPVVDAVATGVTSRERVGMFAPRTSTQVAPNVPPLECAAVMLGMIAPDYEMAFRSVTGMSFSVGPPGADAPPGTCGNTFCNLVRGTRTGCATCRENHARLLHSASDQCRSLQVECFAGLTDIAIPVVRDGRCIAIVWSGQVFRRLPTERDFARTVEHLGGELGRETDRAARRAYFARPVLAPERWRLAQSMLHILATYLRGEEDRTPGRFASSQSPAVAQARHFIREHLEQPIGPAEVVGHVQLNQSYFCRLFRRETRLTLSQFIARARLERARQMLATTAVQSPRSP